MVLSHFSWPALALAGGTVFAFMNRKKKNTLEPGDRQKMVEAAKKAAEDILSTTQRITHTSMIEGHQGRAYRIKSIKFIDEYLMASDSPDGLQRRAFFGRLSGLLVSHAHV